MIVGGQTEARAQLSSTIIDYHEPFDQGFITTENWGISLSSPVLAVAYVTVSHVTCLDYLSALVILWLVSSANIPCALIG